MKILVVQNRMGLGDTIIFLPFIEAISKKFGVPVTCLVKRNSKANEIFKNNRFIKDFIFLDRDKNKGDHSGILGSLSLIKKLKHYKFDKVFIFNSSLRFYTISKLSGIKEIFQYPLFKKNNQHIIFAAQNFLKNSIDLKVDSEPKIFLKDNEIQDAKNKFNINDNDINILFGIGGSGPTKRIPANIILKTMQFINKNYNCKFFLATGKDDDEQKILKEILNSNMSASCIPLDNLKIYDILPIIKNCNISICNDTSFSHLSAALGLNTIVMMADTPIIYGSYSSKMHPIIPDGEKTVTHNTLGKNKINPEKIFLKFKDIIN